MFFKSEVDTKFIKKIFSYFSKISLYSSSKNKYFNFPPLFLSKNLTNRGQTDSFPLRLGEKRESSSISAESQPRQKGRKVYIIYIYHS